jgi:GT2 family glycosyltransferase
MPVFDDMKFEHQEFAIGGKLVTGSIIIKEYEYRDPIAVEKVIKEKLLERLVDHIIENKLAEFTELFVFIDGPKSLDEIPLVNAVNEIAQKISGFKEFHVVSHSTNLGLAKSIRHGIDFVLEKNQSVIVVEDDLIVSESFL